MFQIFSKPVQSIFADRDEPLFVSLAGDADVYAVGLRLAVVELDA